MQELRAQIQAQLKLADTLKKISEAAGKMSHYIESGICYYLYHHISNILGIEDIVKYLGNQCDVSWTHYTSMYLNYLSWLNPLSQIPSIK